MKKKVFRERYKVEEQAEVNKKIQETAAEIITKQVEKTFKEIEKENKPKKKGAKHGNNTTNSNN